MGGGMGLLWGRAGRPLGGVHTGHLLPYHHYPQGTSRDHNTPRRGVTRSSMCIGVVWSAPIEVLLSGSAVCDARRSPFRISPRKFEHRVHRRNQRHAAN